MTQSNKKLKQKLFYLERGLQGDQLEQLYNTDASLIPALLKAMQDPNELIVKRAAQILLNLKNIESQEALCQLAIEANHPLAVKLALQAGYLPQAVAKRALFHFVTQQWDKYDALDFDRRLLSVAYTLENEPVRRRIADLIRQSGRIELLEIIAGTQRGSHLNKLGESEWTLMIELMEKGARYQELWELALLAPARYSFLILDKLATSNWQPSQPDEQFAYGQLKQLVTNCETPYPPTVRLLSLAHALKDINSLITLKGSAVTVTHLAISPNSKLIACAYDNGIVQLWSLETNQVLNTFYKQFELPSKHGMIYTPRIGGLAFTPDSKQLALETNGNNYYRPQNFLWLLNLPDGKIEKTFEGNIASLDNKYLGFTPDGSLLINGSQTLIQIWNVVTGELHRQFTPQHPTENNGYYNNRYAIVSPNGKMVAVVDRDYTSKQKVGIWNIANNQLLKTIVTEQAAIHLAFNADGSRLAIIHKDAIEIWELPKGKLVTTIDINQRKIGNKFLFTADGRLLLGAINDHIRFWRLPEGKHIHTVERAVGEDNNIAISRQADILVTTNLNQINVYLSRLVQIANLPMDKLVPDDLSWIQSIKSSPNISRIERQWLRFVEALLSWRWRHEIEIDEDITIEAGEFDVEL